MKVLTLLYNGEEITLNPNEEYTIGRIGHDATIEIDDSSASRKHGIIIFDGTKVLIKDTNSLNGISINGQKIVSNVFTEISPNDTDRKSVV